MDRGRQLRSFSQMMFALCHTSFLDVVVVLKQFYPHASFLSLPTPSSNTWLLLSTSRKPVHCTDKKTKKNK